MQAPNLCAICISTESLVTSQNSLLTSKIDLSVSHFKSVVYVCSFSAYSISEKDVKVVDSQIRVEVSCNYDVRPHEQPKWIKNERPVEGEDNNIFKFSIHLDLF